jgi:hypothetical protein
MLPKIQIKMQRLLEDNLSLAIIKALKTQQLITIIMLRLIILIVILI